MSEYAGMAGMTRSNLVSAPANAKMVQNLGGGYGYRTGDWAQMRRWLILGSDRNAYYATARKLTLINAQVLLRCLAEDYKRYVELLVEARSGGTAPKSDTAIFALAVLYTHGSNEAKWYAQDRINEICRHGGDIQQFSVAVTGKVKDGKRVDYMRGWGRAVRSAVERWLVDRELKSLVYQLIKYRARHGTSMKRLIQLSHPRPDTDIRSAVFKWAIGGGQDLSFELFEDTKQAWAFEQAMSTAPTGGEPTDGQRRYLIDLVANFRLPWEAIPNSWLKDPDVLEALLANMPITATVRNISRLARTGTLARPHVKESLISKITSPEIVSAQNIHPIRLFQAYITYKNGQGIRSSWPVDQDVVKALEIGFYTSFGNIVPTGLNRMIALDVSGSMSGGEFWGDCSGMYGVAPREAAAALALITMRTEPWYHVVAFSSGVSKVALRPEMTIHQVSNTIRRMTAGRTNMGAAIEYAAKNRLPVDMFEVYTDNEANSGTHPSVALTKYQQQTGRPARAAFVAMQSYNDSVADPDRSDMMDFVGFDPTTPEMLRRFATGELDGIQD